MDRFSDLSKVVESLEGESKSFMQSMSTLLGWLFPCRQLCASREERQEARAQRRMRQEFRKRQVCFRLLSPQLLISATTASILPPA